MRTTTAVLFATVLSLSSSAFAATPAATSTRETRMNEALNQHRAVKAGAPVQVKAGKAPVTKKHRTAKKHHAKKPHANAARPNAPAVKATPATTK